MTQRREAPAEVCYTCPGCGRGLTVFVALTGLPRCARAVTGAWWRPVT